MNYQRMIEILQDVKKLRLDCKNHSPYVCDNIGEVTNDDAIGAEPNPEAAQIRRDISNYIDGAWGLHHWMRDRDGVDYSRNEEAVQIERIKMIDNLIIRYQDQIQQTQGENHGS